MDLFINVFNFIFLGQQGINFHHTFHRTRRREFIFKSEPPPIFDSGLGGACELVVTVVFCPNFFLSYSYFVLKTCGYGINYFWVLGVNLGCGLTQIGAKLTQMRDICAIIDRC